MRLRALFAERAALLHAEAVLLVRDGKTEIVKAHVLREQGVRADGDIAHALLQRGFDRAFFLCLHRAGQKAYADAERREKALQGFYMLLRQNLRRRHESALVSGPLCRPQKRRRDKRFAAADIAL